MPKTVSRSPDAASPRAEPGKIIELPRRGPRPSPRVAFDSHGDVVELEGSVGVVPWLFDRMLASADQGRR